MDLEPELYISMVPEGGGMEKSFTFSDTKKSRYEQIYEFMRDEIISGRYGPGDKVPSKRSLAEALQCSLNTVQNAYAQLTDEGYLYSRQKSGFYVAALEGLDPSMPQIAERRESDRKEERFRFDFSYQGIDREAFPVTLWKRLSREVMNDEKREFLDVRDAKGDEELRSAIASYLRLSRSVQCTSSRILISSGTEYLLGMLIQLLDENTVYAIENPGYEKLSQLFTSNRVSFRSVDVDSQGLSSEGLEASGADVVCITPSHQFPTGTIMPVGRRLRLLSWAQQKKGRYIIEDDYDSEFRYAGKPIPSLQGLDQSGSVIYLGSFSKSLFPSLRISYLVLPEPLMEVYDRDLSFYMCPVPLLQQRTLARFLSAGHFSRHLNRMRNIYKEKREVLVRSLLSAFPSLEIEGAAAGGHIVIRVHNGMGENELERRAEEAGIRVYGLSRFYSRQPEPSEAPPILLGYASLSLQEIDEAVTLLRDLW